MDPDAPPYGESQMVALTMAPKATALLSIVGASYILIDIARGGADANAAAGGDGGRRRSSLLTTNGKRRTTYQRLIFGLSVCDILFAGALFASTWPAPVGTPHVWQALGNVQTCTAQGVFFHLGSAAVLYTASLSTYYVFSIRNGWPRTRIENAEKWLHIGPILFSIATMIPSLILGLYNSSDTVCHIAASPHGCSESWQRGDKTATCKRGDNATLYNLLFNLVPKWTSIVIVTINMVLVYLSVRKRERRGRRWSIHGNSGNSGPAASLKMTTQIAQQCYWFVGALYLTNFMGIAVKVGTLSESVVPFGVTLTSSILLPTQGLWNAFVYLRPRYLSIRRAKRMSLLQRRRRSSAGPLVPGGSLDHSEATSDDVPSPQGAYPSEKAPNAVQRVLIQLRASGYKSSQLLSSVIETVQHGGMEEPNEDSSCNDVDTSITNDTKRDATSSCPFVEDCFEENEKCDKTKVQARSSFDDTESEAIGEEIIRTDNEIV